MVRARVLVAMAAFPLAACSTEQGNEALATVEAPGEEVSGTAPEAGALLKWAASEFGEDGFIDMKYAAFDLNDDGTDELLAHFIAPTHCGSGGCNLYVFEQGEDGLAMRGKLTVTRLPVGVGEGKEQGWRDLVVTVGGGGMAEGLRNVPWTGEAYHANPTVPPALSVDSMATELLSRD